MSRNKEDEFQYISEDDYKTLISVYQQKTFKLFNENISLEAKVATLSSMVENLNETIGDITKEQEKLKKRTSRKTKVTLAKQDEEESILDNEEIFN
jgi:cell division septum initiation protein DivIVA